MRVRSQNAAARRAQRRAVSRGWAAVGTLLGVIPALADVRVQDIARLQGQRTNKLMGFGLVVGLDGTGDGAKSATTIRALMALHKRFQQPVLDANELRVSNSVALVTVEATIPEFGAREGQTLDVVVSAIGPAKSLAGGQLLMTPLQDATLTIPDILALAGGRIELADSKSLRRGVIRGGCTLEDEFIYAFIDEDRGVTLVLDDSHAGWGWAQMLARAINHEVGSGTPAADDGAGRNERRVIVGGETAVALGPKNVRVQIPVGEMARPAGFITRVLQTQIFLLPEQQARVVINRTTKSVSFTGAVTIAPTVLQLPGLGTVTVGGSGGAEGGPAGLVGVATDQAEGTQLERLLTTLSAIKASPDQMIAAVEHLHRTGSLHARLIYEE